LNALRGHKAKITTVVDGIAASAASFIAMAGDEIVMNRNSELMIHDASGVCVGNAKDMQAMHSDLERISNNIASIYAERSGGTVEDWRAAMLAETWYSADEAVEAGLADRVAAPKDSDAKAKNAFDLSIFNYAGRQAAPTPTPLATEAEVEKEKEAIPMATLNEGLAERLGINADADEETILSALDEALSERAAEEPAPVAASLPDGVVAIDAATLAELQASARRGEEARTRQEAAERASVVENAISTGRITPAQRDAWLNRLETDHAEVNVLNSLAPVYPVGNEIGHAGTTDHLSADDSDAIYAALYGNGA
jgi:ClpP class serine protease